MSEHHLTIDSAYWINPGCACVLLSDNWNFESLPPLKLNDPAYTMVRLRRMPSSDLAYFTAYERKGTAIEFILDPNRHPHIDFHTDPVAVVGNFNDWGSCSDRSDFELESRARNNQQALFSKSILMERLGLDSRDSAPIDFKFITRSGHWINPLSSAPNLKTDPRGNINYFLKPNSNGSQAFLFNLSKGRGMDRPLSVGLDPHNYTPILPGLSFYDLKSTLPLGATIEADQSTSFRIFAPRATQVSIEIQIPPDPSCARYPLKLSYDQLTWEINLPSDLSGAQYQFYIEGANDGITTHFDGSVPVLDPYAKATLGPEGPAVVLNPKAVFPSEDRFHPPHWHDLSILECHIKDLTARLPKEGQDLSEDTLHPNHYKGSFAAISRYLNSKDNYLLTLGINAIELLPIQQFDSPDGESYHWGYMTNNYFSPCVWYADRENGQDAVESFQQMIADFHRFDKAVILDVVYNHVGEPPHLARIDKAYYFYLDPLGAFENWSGCGNTLRSESAMTKHLIIESLCHLVQSYDIDGFRFDLAELIGIEVLKEIATALKALKPSIILIAEPWSFRGEIKRDLRHAGFMFWNDEFREFALDYVRGQSSIDALNYFIKGSTAHLAAWPSQSVNYIASHDDRAWIDKLTENPDHQGQHPTETDIRRTHMAAALIYASLGTPMIHQGLDFLHSKEGIENTYQRGDLNALDYSALKRQLQSHHYFQSWIQFRQSAWGDCLRLENSPSETYMKIFRSSHSEHSSAVILYNADYSKGGKQILLMLNPHFESTYIPLGQHSASDWKLIASIDRFNLEGIETDFVCVDRDTIELPPLSIFLAVRPAWNG